MNAQPASDVILYQPQIALRLHYPEEFDKRQPVGDNPPPGAMIDYYLKTAPKEEVSLDILDSSGKVVRHLSSKEKKEGEQPLLSAVRRTHRNSRNRLATCRWDMQPPLAAPNDDGINFMGSLRASDVIDQALVVTNGPDDQAAGLRESHQASSQYGRRR